MVKTRAKYYLAKTVKNRLRHMTSDELGFSEDFILQVNGEGDDWLQFSLKDPADGLHFFMVKVTEKFS